MSVVLPLVYLRGSYLSVTLAAAAIWVSGCRRDTPAPVREAVSQSGVRYGPESVQRTTLGGEPQGKPWIAHVQVCDLDRDGLADVIACEAQKNQVVWIRQTARGVFSEVIVAEKIPGVVHAEPVDIDADGDLDLVIASMGIVFPSNEKTGSVIVLENDGRQNFTPHVALEGVARVTDVRVGDFNRDGRLDLAVAQFGYDQGEIRWLENLGGWTFRSHVLLSLSGTINVCVADMNGDATPDIVAVVSQQWEEIYLFSNDGSGGFTNKVIFGSNNEDFGSSGISLADLNRDGRPDVLYTNGDGFDYAEPGSRPWHGVQWLENLGGGQFRYHRIGDLAGAYSPAAIDFDGDGAMDVVAVSGFNDWKNPASVSLMLFRNDGRLNFTAFPLAHLPTHLMAACTGDLDGNGRTVIVTGGFHAYPPHDHMSAVSVWRRTELK